MEPTSFVLGMLSVIGVAVVTLVVLGMVKIYKLNKKHSFIVNELNLTRDNIYSHINTESRYANQRMVEMERHAQLHVDDLKRELMSYVDSRIDKIQSKPKEILKG